MVEKPEDTILNNALWANTKCYCMLYKLSVYRKIMSHISLISKEKKSHVLEKDIPEIYLKSEKMSPESHRTEML